jgi:hypothetical protein
MKLRETVFKSMLLVLVLILTNNLFSQTGLSEGSIVVELSQEADATLAQQGSISYVLDDVEELLPPQNLVAYGWDSMVYLTWDESVDQYPLGYRIYRMNLRYGSTAAERVNRNYEMIDQITGDQTEYMDYAVINDTSFSYYITAFGPEEESEPSNTADATPTAQVAPSVTDLTATMGDQSVILSWSSPTYDLPLVLEGFQVMRNQVLLADTEFLNYIDDDVTNGNHYTYSVTAVYNLGNSQAEVVQIFVNPTPWTPLGMNDGEAYCTVEGTLYVDGELTISEDYWLAAFFENDPDTCRGLTQIVQSAYWFEVIGDYADQNETIIFKLYNESDDQVDDLQETAVFEIYDYISIDLNHTTYELFSLTIEINGEGSTEPEPGIHTFPEDEMLTITAFPEDGHFFDFWDINGEVFYEPSVYLNMTQHFIVTAYFIPEYDFNTPQGVSTQHGDNQAVVSWSEPVDYNENMLLGYVLYRDNELLDIGIIEDLYYYDQDVDNSIWYEYKVAAIYRHGESMPSSGAWVYPNPTPWANPYIPYGVVETEMTVNVSLYVDGVVTDSGDYWIAAFHPLSEAPDCNALKQNLHPGFSVVILGALSHEGEDFSFSVYDDHSDYVYEAQETVTFAPGQTIALDLNITTIADVYALTTVRNGNGTINPVPGQYEYQAGSEVLLQAQHASGWEFSHWTINSVDYFESDLTIVLDANTTAVANFERTTQTLTVALQGEGTTMPPVGAHTYYQGEYAVLNATPSQGHSFERWEIGDNSYYTRTVNLLMASDRTATAYFAPIEPSTIFVSPNTFLYDDTSPSTFDITATISPSAALIDQIVWSSSNPNIATVSNVNSLTATVNIQIDPPPGIALITATVNGLLTASSTIVVPNTIIQDAGDIIDNTLTLADHPFLINTNLIIDATRNPFVIENGAVLCFDGDYGVSVDGELDAENVSFIGAADGDNRNQWIGLIFNSGSGFSSIDGSTIVNAVNPLTLNNVDLTIENLEIDGGDIDSNEYAVKINGDSSPDMSDLKISNYGKGLIISDDDGTRTRTTTPTLTNVRVRNSTGTVRTDDIGMNVTGEVNLTLDDALVEDYHIGIKLGNNDNTGARVTSTPTLTNIRIRNNTGTVRTDSYGLSISGDIEATIDDALISDYDIGVHYENSSSGTPTLTNMRIRHGTSTIREQGLVGISLHNLANVVIGDSNAPENEITGYEVGVRIESTQRYRTTTPTLTNLRVRNSTSTIRTDDIGIDLVGNVDATLDDVDVEGYSTGINYDNTYNSSTPTMTNIRVRNSTGVVRDLGLIGISLNNLEQVSISGTDENPIVIEDYEIGIKVTNDNGMRELTTPTLTNIRVRNSTGTVRTESIGFMLDGEIDGDVAGNTIEGYDIGVRVMGENSTLITGNSFIDCAQGIYMTGALASPTIKRNRLWITGDSTNGSRLYGTSAFIAENVATLTINNNTLHRYPKGLVSDNSNVSFFNNIVWHDTLLDDPIVFMNGGGASIEYNNIKTGTTLYPENGNINQNPLFVSSIVGNFALQELSPCIDAGDPDYSADEDGSVADIGAIPYLKAATPIIDPPSQEFNEPILLTIISETENTEIRYTLNGDEPTPSSLLYLSPIEIEATTTVKAKAFFTVPSEWNPSLTAVENYVFTMLPVPTVAVNPYPAHEEQNVPITTSLGWTYISDPLYMDPIGYKVNVWSGEIAGEPSQVYVTGGAGSYVLTEQPIVFEYGTTYFWQVIPTVEPESRTLASAKTRAAKRSLSGRADAVDCPIWWFHTEEEPLADTETGDLIYNPAEGYYSAEIDVDGDGNTDILILFTPELGADEISLSFTYSTNPDYPSVQLFPNPDALGAFFGFNIGETDDIALLKNGVVTLQFPNHPGGFWFRHSEGDWQNIPSSVITGPSNPLYSFSIILADLVIEGGRSEGHDLEIAGDDGVHTLPVQLSSFTASVTSSQFVELQWIAETETNMLGYNIYRGNENQLSTALKINPYVIAATNSSTGSEYSFSDEDVVSSNDYYYWLQSMDMNLSSTYHGPVSISLIESDEEVPEVYVTELKQNYPNPFNPVTTISYSLQDETYLLELKIYNIRGQVIRTLHQGPHSKGRYTINWEGDSDAGKSVPSGLYFYRMLTPTYSKMHKMLLVK